MNLCHPTTLTLLLVEEELDLLQEIPIDGQELRERHRIIGDERVDRLVHVESVHKLKVG
jgi:hypothetical protein